MATRTFVSNEQKTYYNKYTDKYFLRSLEILKALDLNTWVQAKIFIRKGNCLVHGISECLDVIRNFSDIKNNKGQVWSLEEGDYFDSCETLMVIYSPIQELITLETVLLGILSAATTESIENEPLRHCSMNSPSSYVNIQNTMSNIVNEANKNYSPRPVYYFGARHWRWDLDYNIAKAAYLGGAENASTDRGAENFPKYSEGFGTTPHSIQCIFHWKYGKENAVFESLKAFDKIINRSVPRIALVDYRNKEITDSIKCCKYFKDQGRILDGIRIDTCGENFMQGANREPHGYWGGKGVTITGVEALGSELKKRGFGDTKISLTSGFGDIEKVKAFSKFERNIGRKIFDSLGVGGIFESRCATMDITAVGEKNNLQPISKTGRNYSHNMRLKRII